VRSILIIFAAAVVGQASGAYPPQIEELQSAAKRALRSLPGLDRTSGIELSDHVPEQRFSAACRGLSSIRLAAVSLFAAEGFDSVVSDLAFPQNAAVFLKANGAEGSPIQKAVLYFAVAKSPYIECQYVIGAFAADVGRSSVVDGPMQTEAGEIAQRVLGRLQGRITDTPDLAQSQQDIEILKRFEVSDPILCRARDQANRLIAEVAPPVLKRTTLLIIDLAPNSDPRLQLFRTANCTGAYRAFSVPVIVCSGAFMREMEASIRRFEEANDLIASETKILDFARSLEANPAGVLTQLRRQTNDDSSAENHITAHLKVALMFFAGHELGHLMQTADGRSYNRGPIGRDQPDRRIRASVVNLCKQADAMAAEGFRLHGFDSGDGPFWSKRVKQIESAYREELGELQAERSALWDLEVDADRVGNDMSLKFLDMAEQNSNASLLEEQHLLIETLFVTGIMSWYRDLAAFMDSSCGAMSNSVMLNLCFASRREGYAAAGRLFGEVHRHILLRSLQSIRAVIEKRRHLFEKSFILGQPITSVEDVRRADPVAAQREIWRLGDLQRYQMVSALMDTPLKLANAGCASGWYAELKAKSGPKMIMFDFYRIEDEVARMFRAAPSRGSGEYDGWFAQVLRLARHQSGAALKGNGLFRVNSERGDVDLDGLKLPISFTFSCEYGGHDSSPTARKCFSTLHDEWLQYLTAQKYSTEVVTDATVTGWTRILYGAIESGAERFRFLYESEMNPSQTSGYAQIRIVGSN